MNSTARAVLVSMMLSCLSSLAETPVHSTISLMDTNRVRISWATIPGKSYVLKTTTNLSSTWAVLTTQPVRFEATTNQASYAETIATGSRFYQVVKLDTEPPEVIQVYPLLATVAVDLFSVIRITLSDETGLDPATIFLTIGTNAPITVTNAQLTWSSNAVI